MGTGTNMKNKKNIVHYEDIKVGETYRAVLSAGVDQVDVICTCFDIRSGIKRIKDIYSFREDDDVVLNWGLSESDFVGDTRYTIYRINPDDYPEFFL